MWPWDFDAKGKISPRRDSWGSEDHGNGKERGMGLEGGKRMPAWTDPGLPLTYTSSHKVMLGELDALKSGAALKRGPGEEVGWNARMPVKKPRLCSMSTELERMKGDAEKKRRKDKITDMEDERYSGAKPELRDALQVVDTLMRSATETENHNATLEAMLLKNEAQHIQDADDMFDEWLAYNEVKRTEVNRIHQDHLVEIKSRDATIETLRTEAKRSRARLEKVRTRDEHSAHAKRRPAQERHPTRRKLRQIQDRAAVLLDELAQLDPDADESDGAAAEEEATEGPKQKPKGAEGPAATGISDRELRTRKSTLRAGMRRIRVNLAEDDEEEDEEEGDEEEGDEEEGDEEKGDEEEGNEDPIPHWPTRELRSSVRAMRA